jgi:hypothetical protein
MKCLASTAFLLFVSFASPADSFRLEGQAYQPSTNIDIVWKATNDLPRGLWIYKVMPEAFSAAVVSNAMVIGRFQKKDFSKGDHPLLKDKHLIYFFDWNEPNRRRRSLYIAPTLGAMEYQSEADATAPVEGVPTSDEAEMLAREILFQLGIDRSLLADKVQKGYDDTTTKFDRNRKQLGPPQVNRRGVAFARRIDGVLLSQSWSFLIHFGNHGAVEDFSLNWRNLLPYESRHVLTTNQIVEAIKSGKAVLAEQFGDLTDLNQTKKLTVLKITPRYYNGRKGEALEFLHPYADLELVADLGNTNTALFFLTCPIIDEAQP